MGMQTDKTVDEVIDLYEVYLEKVKENRPSSIATTTSRLRSYFTGYLETPIATITPNQAARCYTDLATRNTRRAKKTTVDTHRNSLAEAKTFMKWCAAKEQRYVFRNPLENVQGTGKRKHGKEQLRIDEARKWLAKAIELAEQDEPGAVAAMMSLLMGLRCSEIISRTVRDLDDGGRLLWIPHSKTEAGRRTLEVPSVLQPYLLALADDKLPTALLFDYHVRNWPRQWVKRICTKAAVPRVCAHAMRGLHATLAVRAGMAAHAVAAQLGHESFATTAQSYADPSALKQAEQQRTLTVLQGGR
jgi:integrase